MVSDKKNVQPPYGPLKYYSDFLDLLDRRQVDKVDKEFLKSYDIAKGGEHKLITGLKFLNLIHDDGTATENLKSLSLSGDEKIKNLEKIMLESYSFIFNKIKLEKATLDDLVNEFIRNYGVAKKSATDSAKIFLLLAERAGINIPENLKRVKRVTPKNGKKKKVTNKKTDKKVPVEKTREGMHSIIWGDEIEMYIKENDKDVVERAKLLIDLYSKTLKSKSE